MSGVIWLHCYRQDLGSLVLLHQFLNSKAVASFNRKSKVAARKARVANSQKGAKDKSG